MLGPTVCEDIWQPGPPATDLALAGAQLIVNISASPFHVGKEREREQMLQTRARDNVCYVAFVNAVGGQDELIFDGHSVVLDDEGEVLARAPGFEEALLVVDVEPEEAVGRRLRDVRRRSLEGDREAAPDVPVVHVGLPHGSSDRVEARVVPFLDDLEQMRLALELGLGDYVRKNGFEDVVIGLSGGIDSALTAAICVEALGSAHVHCVSMPSHFSSEGTRNDARLLAESLGADFLELPIDGVVSSFDEVLAEPFDGREPDLTEENLQARARGVLLMALSNKFGWLVVATGNKSELLGRLRHALRGHGRRVRAPEGRVQDRRVPPGAAPERARRSRADPAVDHRSRTERRAPGQPARRGLAAAVPRARPRARGLRRARPVPGGHDERRVRPGRRRPCARDDRSRGVQAPAGAAGGEATAEGVRARLALAYH